MHTPTEAAALWCPMARAPSSEYVADSPVEQVVGGCNRGDSTRATCNCIADRCAMWRWEYALNMSGEQVRLDVGYCGIAGRPELVA